MYISKLGFIYFKDNKFEDGALVDGKLVNRSFFPSASPRPHLLPKLDNERESFVRFLSPVTPTLTLNSVVAEPAITSSYSYRTKLPFP